jgi:anti-sigma factor RsiW
MEIVSDDDGHVRDMLGLYLLGALSRTEEAEVERHLSQCEKCLREYDEHGDVPQHLNLLSEQEVASLITRTDQAAAAGGLRPTNGYQPPLPPTEAP